MTRLYTMLIFAQVPLLVLFVSAYSMRLRGTTLNFYCSTLWVGQVMSVELNKDPEVDDATRMGEFALMIHSIGASSLLTSNHHVC